MSEFQKGDMNMKKTVIFALILGQLLMLASCGNVDNDSSRSGGGSSSAAAETTETTETTESPEDTSELQLESITVRMDNQALHEGVEFTDSEVLEKTAAFYTSLKENGKIVEPESKETLIGGDWMFINLSDGGRLYFESGAGNYVRLGKDTYYTEDNSGDDYKSYMLDYLSQNGYWG